MSIRVPSKAQTRRSAPTPKSKPAKPTKTAQKPAEKFKKDELSLGRGRQVSTQLTGEVKRPNLSQIIHNTTAAKNLKEGIRDVLKLVRFGQPLPASESPRPGKGGQLVTPSGDPLIRVKLDDGGGILGAGQYGLVNPKTNEFYLQTNSGGFNPQTTFHGPLSLPPKARFEGSTFTPGELKRLEKIANDEPKVKLPPLAQLEKTFQANKANLEFGQPAPDPSNVAAEIPLKSQHPFTYYAVILKDDPTKIVIKQVLTGGFVPAKPGDGTYSQPIDIGGSGSK
ncbi:MAG TPA: hypothetical protein VGD87_05630 [Archangium sp.]